MGEPISEIKGVISNITKNVEESKENKNDFLSNLGFFKKKKDSSTEHFLLQLDDLNLKINDLEKAIVVGIPLAEATDGLQKLNNIQRTLEETESKLNMYLSASKEIKERLSELENLFSSKVNKNQVKILSEKVVYLEKLYAEISGPLVNESILSLVDVTQELRSRIKNLEGVVEKEVVGHSISQNSDNVNPKKAIQNNKPKGFFSSIIEKIIPSKNR